nr:MAG TPA: hypothetical protein [Bacteriophage sp.]
MNIVNITTTKTAEEQTDHASYSLEYVVSNNRLERVQASVFKKNATLTSETAPEFYGTLTYENETVYCSLPYAQGISQYVSDFEGYIEHIRAEMPSLAADNQEDVTNK